MNPRVSNRFEEYYEQGSEELDLSHKSINDKDIPEICQFINDNPQITSLNLRGNFLSDAAVKKIAGLIFLKSLNLQDNDGAPNHCISNVGAEILASHPNITHLNLKSNRIGGRGAKALLEKNKLKVLNLADNEIGDDGFDLSAPNTTLRSLNLFWNRIGDRGIINLVKNAVVLSCVKLGSNEFGDNGVKALVSSETLESINLIDSADKVLHRNDGFPKMVSEEGKKMLEVSDPLRRAKYGREVGIATSIPTLKRLSLFVVKESTQDHPEQLDTLKKHHEYNWVVERLSNNKI